MGRIKQIYLKRVAERLFKDHAGDFNADFDANKRMVQGYTSLKSVPCRNKIAGCITRMVRARDKKVE